MKTLTTLTIAATLFSAQALAGQTLDGDEYYGSVLNDLDRVAANPVRPSAATHDVRGEEVAGVFNNQGDYYASVLSDLDAPSTHRAAQLAPGTFSFGDGDDDTYGTILNDLNR